MKEGFFERVHCQSDLESLVGNLKLPNFEDGSTEEHI